MGIPPRARRPRSLVQPAPLLVLALLLSACSCDDDKPRKQQPPPESGTVGVSVTHSDARACDVLLEEQGSARVQEAMWTEGVKGQMQTRSPLVGLAFFNESDGAFAGSAVSLAVGGAEPGEYVVVREATCYDRLGKALESEGAVALHQASSSP